MSMSHTSSICMLFKRPQVSNFLKSCVRFAGGGGQPGGKPTFNWKERRLLGLDTLKKKKTKIKDSGPLNELLDAIDPNDIEEIVVFTPGMNYTVPPPEDETTREFRRKDKKTLNMRQLFGSHKAYGMLPVKVRQPFSYERVFGGGKKKLDKMQSKRTYNYPT